MKTLRLFVLFFIIGAGAYAQSVVDTVGSTPVIIDVVLDNTEVETPWDLMWGPDNTLWYSDDVAIFRYDTATDQTHTIFTLPYGNVLGMAVHPDFSDTPWVYLVVDTSSSYYAGGSKAQLRRYTYSVSGDSLYAPLRILEWEHPGEHVGGRITIGNDRKVYVTTSDYMFWYDHDTVGNCSGKILRVNFDGSVPSDNPRADYTWSYEHRNPQGIVCAPNGRIFSSEFGGGQDELNIILRDHNYGWPYYDGNNCLNVEPDTCTSLTYTYEHAIDVGINPPSGIEYYQSFAIPEFDRAIIEGILTFGGANGGIMVYKLDSDQDSVISKIKYFNAEYGRVRDLCMSPDGKVFFIAHDRDNPDIRVVYNPAAHVGIPPVEEGSSLTFYPNPVTDVLTLVSEQQAIGKWELCSLTGQTITSGNSSSNQQTIHMNGWSGGVYLLHCGNAVYKIVKR